MVDFYLDSDSTEILNKQILELLTSKEININNNFYFINLLELDEFSLDSFDNIFDDNNTYSESNISSISDYSYLSEIDNWIHEHEDMEIELNLFFQKKNKERLQHLPKYKKIKDGDPIINETCNICFEKYKVNQYKRCLHKCGHTYHKKCIDKWLLSCPNMSCPICRKSYIPDYFLDK